MCVAFCHFSRSKSEFSSFNIYQVYISFQDLSTQILTSRSCNSDQASADDRWVALLEQMMEHYFQFPCPGCRGNATCDLLVIRPLLSPCGHCRVLFCKTAVKAKCSLRSGPVQINTHLSPRCQSHFTVIPRVYLYIVICEVCSRDVQQLVVTVVIITAA